MWWRIRKPVQRYIGIARKTARRITWRVLATATRSPTPRVIEQSADGVVWDSSSRAVIEPDAGFVIGEPWRLHTDSFRSLQRIPPWLYSSPSALEWNKVRRHHPERIIDLDEVISLRHFFEWNYYHFFIDVIPKLAQLELAGVDLDVPIVVSPSAVELPFAAQALELGRLADLEWYPQPRQTYLRANRVRFTRLEVPRRCRVLGYRERVEYTLKMIDAASITADPERTDRKVVLIRRPPVKGRLIVDSAEVEDALTARGYELVDAAGMTLVDQVRLFHQTRYLIAAHGAGMTNMIFRTGQEMSIIEMCPDVLSRIPNMRVMATELGFDVTTLVFPSTPGSSAHADMLVDLPELLGAVDRIEAGGHLRQNGNGIETERDRRSR